MNKIKKLTNNIFAGEYSSTESILEEILLEKIAIAFQEKKKEIAIDNFSEDKNPARIKHKQAEQILTSAGYSKIRSGEHQSIWKHLTDKTKELFPLPHHSRELSPGITRKLFSLASEEVVVESLEGFKLKRHRLGTGENSHKEAKVYSSGDDKHQVHYFSNNKKIEVQHFDDFNDADEDASTYVKQ